MVTPLTPEQLQARIEEETGKDIPADVQEDFELVRVGAAENRLGIYKQMCPISGRTYYLLVIDVGGMMARPLAVIPERITAGQFIANYDKWMDISKASAESDPDFKGVKQ